MTSRTHQRSPLAVALLTLLAEAPMHAYRMQQLIKERDKDQVVNVAQPNSVYQTIQRLQRAGLVSVLETAAGERRTVYQLTNEGAETLRDWLRTMLSTPAREFPEFPVALASLPILDLEDARRQLEARVTRLEARLAEMDASLTAAARTLPRLFVIEDEYRREATRVELEWVRALVADLRAGRLAVDEAWLRAHAEPDPRRAQPAGGA